jgi:hypothetical protein
MRKLLTPVGALALAALTFACPAQALPKGGGQQACINECYSRTERPGSIEECTAQCRLRTGNNARAAKAHPKPTSRSVTNSGNGTGHRH